MTQNSIPIGYVEHPAPPALREYVECLWTRGPVADRDATGVVLPDGCIDVVLGYTGSTPGAPPTVGLAVGTMTRPLSLRAAEPQTFVGVRFWPGRALPFLGVPASEITDLRVDIGEVWPRAEASLEDLPATGLNELLAGFETLLLRRLSTSPPVDRAVDGAVRAILRAGGNLSIASLAPALGVTRQHLARAFATHVGVPPKMFARVARVRRVLAKARVAAHVDWAVLALETGYYDQAHLAGEVRELTGRTPTEWLVSR